MIAAMPGEAIGRPAYAGDQLADLVRQVALGDHDAFSELYDATSSVVYGIALRMLRDPSLAEDIALEVYVQIWRCAGTYSRDRGSAVSWMVTMCRSRAIDWLRSAQGRRSRSAELVDGTIPDPGQGPEESCLATQRTQVVKACLEQLPSEQRRLIELAYFSALSQTEIAEHVGLPLGTVKSRIRLGMARLRDSLQLAGASGLC